MNLAKKSVVEKMSTDSIEYSIVQNVCMVHGGNKSGSREGDTSEKRQEVIMKVITYNQITHKHITAYGLYDILLFDTRSILSPIML